MLISQASGNKPNVSLCSPNLMIAHSYVMSPTSLGLCALSLTSLVEFGRLCWYHEAAETSMFIIAVIIIPDPFHIFKERHWQIPPRVGCESIV